jgi:OOP family OmpA-OmpF porin
VRDLVLAAVGIFAAMAAAARAEPALSASGFVGVDWFGSHTALGNSWAPEQVPGTSPLVGGRVSWLALPALPADLQLAIEGELAFAAAFTGSDVEHGRMAYFAPVFAWRAHALLRFTRWHHLAPHLVVGGGGETVTSSSPFMSKESDPVAYWGAGARVPLARGWHLRIDLRHGVMPARGSGATSTLEAALGVGATFGEPAAAPRQRWVEPEVAAPVGPAPAAPERDAAPDPDGDGIAGDADRCPDQPEDFDGFEDDDGCPEPDNDRDGFEDVRDACPGEPETVNGFEDDDGCPDQLPADVVAALAATVRFEPGRARVPERGRAALAPVLAMRRGRAELQLVLVGHPERPGVDELARRRAEAIKWYLVDQGIAGDRLTTRVGDVRAGAVELALRVR